MAGEIKLLFVLIGMVCCSAGPALGQPTKPDPVLDPAQLLAQAKPHLEAALHFELPKLPRISVVTSARVEEMLQDFGPGLKAQLRWQFPELQDSSWKGTLKSAVQAVVSVTPACYLEGTSVIVVIPENLQRMAGGDKSLQAVNSPEFLQLALVRETVRYYLDLRYNFARMRKDCIDGDAYQALQAVIEGRALQITAKVAQRLGTETSFPLLAECYLHAASAGSEHALGPVSYQTLLRLHWACTKGLAFFTALETLAHGNVECLVFSGPPPQPTRIVRPELFDRAVGKRQRDLCWVLDGLPSSLSAKEWNAAQQPWTPEMVRQVAALLGQEERAEKVLAGWDEARSLVWTSRLNPGRSIAFSVARFESANTARAYYGFAIDLQRKQDTMLINGCNSSMRVLESHSSIPSLPPVKEGDFVPVEEAMRSDKKLQFSTGGPSIPVTVVLVRWQEIVFECTWHGLPGDMGLAARLLTNFESIDIAHD